MLGENDFEKWRNFCLKLMDFLKGIVPTLVGTQKWKPDKEELEKELRRLGLAKEDVRITKLEDEIVLDPENPIENVSPITRCIYHCTLGKMTNSKKFFFWTCPKLMLVYCLAIMSCSVKRCFISDKVSLPSHWSLPAPPRHGVLRVQH